ncbi:MAG: alpha/beta hydrolase, partial [Acetobacteraceae bacterium]|nr:alpha/beta hydrolase [Acetobacteraceae bacterium]
MHIVWRVALIFLVVLNGVAIRPTRAQAGVRDRFFVTSDGVRLHYLEAGPPAGRTIVLVPGWTMPAWIWAPQIAAFSRAYHVVAFDPRGQGKSDAPLWGYTPERRGQDIAELVALFHTKVLLVGWSLGVLDSLAYLHQRGDSAVAGLVLVDNSVGEEPAPPPGRPTPRIPHARFMARFVRAMFHVPQPAAYLDRLTEASLRTPEPACRALLAYPVPRAYWREALYATDRPLLYVVRPRFAAQAANV